MIRTVPGVLNSLALHCLTQKFCRNSMQSLWKSINFFFYNQLWPAFLSNTEHLFILCELAWHIKNKKTIYRCYSPHECCSAVFLVESHIGHGQAFANKCSVLPRSLHPYHSDSNAPGDSSPGSSLPLQQGSHRAEPLPTPDAEGAGMRARHSLFKVR